SIIPRGFYLLEELLDRIPQRQGRRSAKDLARGEPGVEREEHDAGERAGEPQAEAGRQVELEDAPGDELADGGGAEGGEQPRDGAHGEELGALAAGNLRARGAVDAHDRSLAPALVLGGDERGVQNEDA